MKHTFAGHFAARLKEKNKENALFSLRMLRFSCGANAIFRLSLIGLLRRIESKSHDVTTT